MAVLDGFDARNIDRVEADRLLRGGAAQGALYPAHCTASGKVLLAGLDPSAWRRYRANAHLSAFTSRTITSLDTLEPELRLIRLRGYALDDGEYEDGLMCIAAPVYSADSVVAVIGISSLASRIADRIEGLAALVKAIAEQASMGSPIPRSAGADHSKGQA
ncbi:MAG: hypothetical protein HOH66_14295 [Rhodospirillaceae bacterium]|nr:hypothetical protein [Rhodospirillaceae bacterium]MBT6119030.1 hypothetical protein [Rhodospirillaceae bacterium]